MSALPDPRPDGDERPLTERERNVLDHIAGETDADDPAFTARLREDGVGEPGGAGSVDGGAARREVLARARRRDLAIQGAVVGGLAVLLLPGAWVAAAVVTLVLLVLPLVLVAQAWRAAHRPG